MSEEEKKRKDSTQQQQDTNYNVTVGEDGKPLPKFGLRDKLAYAAGDFGCNMSFALKGTLTIFWTQFMGIDSIVMASLLLLVQIWDAINDPVIGAIVDADRREYKRHKFLTYIWVGSIGLLVGGAFCFIPWPSAPGIVKNILFVAGYILWDAFYTVANVPYGSILSLLTEDPVQRAQLSTFRSIGGMVGGLGAQMILPILIYDAANNLRGERVFIIALVMGLIGFVAFQFMIRNSVIRVDSAVRLAEEKHKFNLFRAVGHFMRNRPAVGATLAPVGMFLGMYGAQTAVQIMFQAYFKNAKISGVVGMLSYIGIFIFPPFIAKIVKRFGKKEAISFGAALSILAYVLMLVLPITPDGKGLALFIVCQVINAIGAGLGTCLGWSLMADAMDYEEWKFGTRNEGTTYAMHSFFRKLAQGIGPSVGLVLATWLGYDASLKAAQTAEVALNMRYLTAAMYLLSAVLSFIGYAIVFNLDKKTLARMDKDLAVSRAAKAAAAAEETA